MAERGGFVRGGLLVRSMRGGRSGAPGGPEGGPGGPEGGYLAGDEEGGARSATLETERRGLVTGS